MLSYPGEGFVLPCKVSVLLSYPGEGFVLPCKVSVLLSYPGETNFQINLAKYWLSNLATYYVKEMYHSSVKLTLTHASHKYLG